MHHHHFPDFADIESSTCVSVYLSMGLSVGLSVGQSVGQSAGLSVEWYTQNSTNQSQKHYFI